MIRARAPRHFRALIQCVQLIMLLLLGTQTASAGLPLASGQEVLAETFFESAPSQWHSVVMTRDGQLLLGTPQTNNNGMLWVPLQTPSPASADALRVCDNGEGFDLYMAQGQIVSSRPLLADAAPWTQADISRSELKSGCPAPVSASSSKKSRDTLPMHPARVADAIKGFAHDCFKTSAQASQSVRLRATFLKSRLESVHPIAEVEDPAVDLLSQCIGTQLAAAMPHLPSMPRMDVEVELRPEIQLPPEIVLDANGRGTSTIHFAANSRRRWRITAAQADRFELSVAVRNAGPVARIYVRGPAESRQLSGTITLKTDLPGSPSFRIRVVRERAQDAWEAMADALAMHR